MLRKTEESNPIAPTSRIRFVETSGRKYIDQLRVRDPYIKNCKPEEKCLPCSNTRKQSNCKVANVGYTITCQLCKERRVDKSYEGKTCRNAHLRGAEHLRDIEKENENSPSYKHIKTDHEGEEKKVRFTMKVVGRFKTAMNRQLDEGIRIQNKDPKSLLNSKNEYYGPAIKRKILEGKTK